MSVGGTAEEEKDEGSAFGRQDAAAGVSLAGMPKPVPQIQVTSCHTVPPGSPEQGRHRAAGGGEPVPHPPHRFPLCI